MDESKFGKRKYHKGHHVEGQWVFGGYEHGSGRVFMVCVEQRGRDTLLPIIQDWIEEGTTIVSDYWKAYDCLSSEGYEHLKVNHNVCFKDPEHTQIRLNRRGGLPKLRCLHLVVGSHIPRNLARYIFQKRCNEMKLDRTDEFLRLADQLYNPMAPIGYDQDEIDMDGLSDSE